MDALAAAFGMALGWFWFVTMVICGLLGLAGAAFWVWMLVDVLTRETDENNNRLIWTLVVLFAHWVGALIYCFGRRAGRIRRLGR